MTKRKDKKDPINTSYKHFKLNSKLQILKCYFSQVRGVKSMKISICFLNVTIIKYETIYDI